MAARLAEGHSASMVSSKGMQECRAFSSQPALQLEEYPDESLWALSKLQYWAKPISHLTSGSPYCTLENYSQNDRGNMEIHSIQFTAFPRILSQTNQSCLFSGKSSRRKTLGLTWGESGRLFWVDLDLCLTKQKPAIFGKSSRRSRRKVTPGAWKETCLFPS